MTNSIELSPAAQEFAEETGSNPAEDIAMLVSHGAHNSWFLDECLKACDEDRLDGAQEYYHAVAAAADMVRETAECEHESETTPDGYSSFCSNCGETLS